MIRRINSSDREFFLLAADIFYHSDAVEKPLSMKKLEMIFDEMIRSDAYLEGFIFEYEGEKAGYSIISKMYQTEAVGLTVWIEDIFIMPDFRSKGLGKEFFEYIHKLFEGKVYRFRLEVEDDNEIAVNLYKKSGFRVLPYVEMVKDFDYE